MKRMKKLASLVLAMVMALAMTATAFAADNNPHKITITQNTDDKADHQYAAYQIFAGDLATVDGEMTLSNVIWGSGVDEDKIDDLLAALKADKDDVFSGAFANCETAADVAKALSEFNNTFNEESGALDYFARIVEEYLSDVCFESEKGSGDAVIDVIGSGYYLVKDNITVEGTDGAYTRSLLQVVGDSAIVVKSEVPGGDKQVFIDDETTGDANNASIGSHVSYEITSKVPNWVGYDYYYFIMNDTLSEGLTFDGIDSVAVKVGDDWLTRDKDYYIYPHTHNADCYDDDEKLTCTEPTFQLAFADIMQYDVGAKIVVTYSATVNDKAVVGTTGNPNTWTLQYSNKPGESERKDKDGKPGIPDEGEKKVTGETPEEKTLTYVTELDITKYANSVAEEHLLAGAEFTLTGTSHQVVLSTVDYYAEAEGGEYYLLLDGTYTMDEPIEDAYEEIGVGTVDTTTGYIKVGDNYVVPENKDDYVNKKLYKFVKGTADKYADVKTKYVKKTVEETSYVDADVSIRMTTGAYGKISFKDLGAGEYTLTETVTPAGFNTLEPINIVIGFKAPEKVTDGTETCTWTMTWNGEDLEGTAGIFAQDVINQSGSLLPSTGGIGTTIFTIVGAALIIGAGVLLVVKKRMSKN